MLRFALEEWVVICEALAYGKQTILIRSVAEADGPFELQNTSFWLKATFDLAQTSGVKKESLRAASELLRLRPGGDHVAVRHFAKVTGVYEVHKLFAALLLDDLHIWSEEVIRERFAAGGGGLYVMPVRIFRAPTALSMPATEVPPAEHGWIQLPRRLSTAGATTVIDDKAFARVVESLEAILNPTARA